MPFSSPPKTIKTIITVQFTRRVRTDVTRFPPSLRAYATRTRTCPRECDGRSVYAYDNTVTFSNPVRTLKTVLVRRVITRRVTSGRTNRRRVRGDKISCTALCDATRFAGWKTSSTNRSIDSSIEMNSRSKLIHDISEQHMSNIIL